jgi:hypothetical protein
MGQASRPRKSQRSNSVVNTVAAIGAGVAALVAVHKVKKALQAARKQQAWSSVDSVGKLHEVCCGPRDV